MQVLIDNLVYSPIFNLLVMAYIGTVVEGKLQLVHRVHNALTFVHCLAHSIALTCVPGADSYNFT